MTGILSDPCHNCKAPLRLHNQTLKTFNLLFQSSYRRGQNGEQAEVPKDNQGQPIKLKLGGGRISVMGEYMSYLTMLRECVLGLLPI